MRYEILRLLQFAFSLGLIFVAFMGGMFVGWRRWGRPGPVDHTMYSTTHPTGARQGASAVPGHDGNRLTVQVRADRGRAQRAAAAVIRRDLFAPEVEVAGPDGEDGEQANVIDLRVSPGSVRLGLPSGADPGSPGASSPFAPPEAPA